MKKIFSVLCLGVGLGLGLGLFGNLEAGAQEQHQLEQGLAWSKRTLRIPLNEITCKVQDYWGTRIAYYSLTVRNLGYQKESVEMINSTLEDCGEIEVLKKIANGTEGIDSEGSFKWSRTDQSLGACTLQLTLPNGMVFESYDWFPKDGSACQ